MKPPPEHTLPLTMHSPRRTDFRGKPGSLCFREENRPTHIHVCQGLQSDAICHFQKWKHCCFCCFLPAKHTAAGRSPRSVHTGELWTRACAIHPAEARTQKSNFVAMPASQLVEIFRSACSFTHVMRELRNTAAPLKLECCHFSCVLLAWRGERGLRLGSQSWSSVLRLSFDVPS